ncbi:PKD domain-containing protein [Glaciibacter sp. 2TAF33]|uniref:PKD domain-containing protein n=1 Tax=Glaciibacter sp. 2TAF33 TaxID=3233015 RepID=UPI003F8E3DC0
MADDGACAPQSAVAGLCDPPPASGAINDGGVDLSAGYDANSGGGGRSNGGTSDGPGASNGDGRVVVDDNGTAVNDPNNPLVFVRDGFTVNCTPGTPCDPNLVVSISDVASFKPAVPSQGMEPDGWMVVGLPTNFYAAASVHVRSGLLLGFPADVRFTPAGYRWDYGDGDSLHSRTGGATWAAQNLPEFSETTTSHTFRASGSHTIVLDVIFTAEYRFAGQPWRGIRGTLAVPTQPLTAVAGDAKTVLVERECTLNPSGPGC